MPNSFIPNSFIPNSMITDVPLTILLFGPMQVLVNGHPLPHLRSRKTLWLLALLTLRSNQLVTREWLAAILWPDLEQRRAIANLRPILSELRDSLGSESGRLQAPRRSTLLLDLTGAEVDVPAFDASVKSKQLPVLQQAVSLYRGPLLEGCLEEWVFQERSEREQSCLQALYTLAETAFAAGDYRAAIGHYKQAVSISPLEDAARRGLMEALVKSGDRNAALQVYRDFVKALTSADASPAEETSDFYARLRTEGRQQPLPPAMITTEATPKPLVRGYLPHSLTDLIGREDEKSEVAASLRRSRLVTLTGMGGIGKTRLALAVAADVIAEYADGVWLAGLEAVSDGPLVVRQIASVLGVKEEAERSLLQSLSEHLRARRLLLVLDNCEHLLEASAQIAGLLLRECPQVRILATSREALGIVGETAWRVPSLAAPDPEHLPTGKATLLRVLSGYESVRLFIERAQAYQPDFTLNANNAAAVAKVCAQLQGIPLAIELAAVRVKALTVEQIVARLDDYLGLLAGGNRAALPRQQTLRATLDWSYALLNDTERLLLERLSLFVGGWNLESAEAVGAGNGIEAPQVADILTSLVDKSLALCIPPLQQEAPWEVQQIAQRGEEKSGRYRFSETVRQYALEKLQASGQMETIKTKYRDWYVHLAEQADLEMSGADQRLWLQRLETEHDNLRAVLAYEGYERATTQGAETNLRLTGSLWRFWDIHGHHSEGRQHLARSLEREEAQADTIVRGKALTGAGSLAHRQGDYAAARAFHSESLRIQRALGNQRGAAAVLSNLGNVAQAQGEYATAQTLQEESLRIHRDLGNQLGIADTLSNLCNAFLEQGDYTSARSVQEESLRIRRELGDKRGIAWSLDNLGIIAFLQDDKTVARLLFEECLHIRRNLNDRYGIALSLNNLGSVTIEMGDYVLTHALFKESLTIFEELENKHGGVECLEGLATMRLLQSQALTATRLLAAATALRENIAAPRPLREREKYANQIEQARSALGTDAFAAAWAEGSALTWKQAVHYALTE